MRGNVWAVGALLKCDKHETKIFEAEEERIAKLNANPANQAPQKHVFSWIDEEVPEWLTPGECAKILGVSPRTVVRLIDQGDLEEFKTKGGHRRIRDCDLEVYMEDLKKFKSEMDNLEKLDKLVSADGPPQEVEALE
ncbi:MAG: helix-turn-helix domain-containing protein [Nitrospinae bacterium]|nr:helix-turn-helix domain-containing protein [Nitrospinota bacterium]